MARIFSSLAVVAVTLIVINLFLGLMAGDYNEGSAQLRRHVEKREMAKNDRRTPPAEVDKLTAEMDAARAEFEPVRKRTAWHRLLGILAALVGVLVQCIAVTYFIGTARWCKEVVEAYSFDPEYVRRSAKIKSRCFPWSLLGIITIVVIVTFGAAADPATLRSTTARWVVPHFWAAMLGTGLVVYCLYQQAVRIQTNNGLVNEITEAVRVEREKRGLDNAPAVAESN